MIKKLISNSELQSHIHHIGLEQFLEQLEAIYNEAYHDLADFEDGGFIATQYENARYETNKMKRNIFYKEKKEDEN